MNENGASNITQVLKGFQRFLLTYESHSWVKNATVEDIKSAFKLGNFIEKTTATFKAKELLAHFLILLEIWTKENNLKIYNEEFFTLANDHLLEKLFKFPNVKESTLDIGVRVYSSLYPKEHFRECIKKLILTSSSLGAIVDFVNISVSDKAALENNIILGRWSEYCKLGLKDALKSEIEMYLSLYNVEEKLPKLISILALKETLSQNENGVRDLILEGFLTKMLDRSLLSKTFWLSLFKKPDLHDIKEACKNYTSFLESMLNFIEYLGGMMTRDNTSDFLEWKSDPAISFCHEISYLEIVIFLKILCDDTDIKRLVLERLEQTKEYSNSELWNQILENICG